MTSTDKRERWPALDDALDTLAEDVEREMGIDEWKTEFQRVAAVAAKYSRMEREAAERIAAREDAIAKQAEEHRTERRRWAEAGEGARITIAEQAAEIARLIQSNNEARRVGDILAIRRDARRAALLEAAEWFGVHAPLVATTKNAVVGRLRDMADEPKAEGGRDV